MVAFVAPWCGHCKNLGPEFTAAAQSLTPLIPFYAVDCDDSSNKGLCAEYGIQGFPTIKAFPRAGKGAARDYNGERKKGALVDYAKGLVPDRVKKLRADDGAEKIITSFISEVSLERSSVAADARNQICLMRFSYIPHNRPSHSCGKSSDTDCPRRCDTPMVHL